MIHDEIQYTFVYNVNGKPRMLVEPNPNFIKDYSTKELCNVPSTERMTNLLKCYKTYMPKETLSQLDTALYFGPFFDNKNSAEDLSGLQVQEHDCIASSWIEHHVIYNSNLHNGLRSMMQEFSAANEVYFGWNNYYLCSLKDFKLYVSQLSDKIERKTDEELLIEWHQNDSELKTRTQVYDSFKNQNSWAKSILNLVTNRLEQEARAKVAVDDRIAILKRDYDTKVNNQTQYMVDLLRLLSDIERNLTVIPNQATHLSLLLTF
jgi:hypothetical protein